MTVKMYGIQFGIIVFLSLFSLRKASACTHLTATSKKQIVHWDMLDMLEPLSEPEDYDPEYYENPSLWKACWTISANNSYDIIELKTNFSTADKYDPGCKYYHLQVYDSIQKKGKGVRKCGQNQSLTLYSSSDALYVEFVDEEGMAGDGFTFEYKSTSKDNYNTDDWISLDSNTTTSTPWKWWYNSTQTPTPTPWQWWNNWTTTSKPWVWWPNYTRTATPTPYTWNWWNNWTVTLTPRNEMMQSDSPNYDNSGRGAISSHVSYESSSMNTAAILGISFGGISFLTIIILVTVVLLVVFVFRPRQGNTNQPYMGQGYPGGQVSYINTANPNQSSVMMHPATMHNHQGNQQSPYVMQPQQQLQYTQPTPMMNPTFGPSSVVTNPITSNQQQPQIQQQQPPFNAAVNQQYQPQIQKQQVPFNASVTQQQPIFNATTNQQQPHIQQPQINANQQYQAESYPDSQLQFSKGLDPALIQFQNPGDLGENRSQGLI